jgi:hypothetical protein
MTRHVRQRVSDQVFLAERMQHSGLRDVSVLRTGFGLEVRRRDRRLTVPERPEAMSQDEWADNALAVLLEALSGAEG